MRRSVAGAALSLGIGILGIGILGIGLLGIAACAPGRADPPEQPRAEGVRLAVGGETPTELRSPAAELDGEQLHTEAVEVAAAGEHPLSLSAPTSTWSLPDRKVRFEGGVLVERGPFTLRCKVLEAELGENGQLARAHATGGVFVTRPPYEAQGQEAVLDLAAGTLVLSGAPTLSDGGATLSGREVVLDLDEEQASCADCRLVVPPASP